MMHYEPDKTDRLWTSASPFLRMATRRRTAWLGLVLLVPALARAEDNAVKATLEVAETRLIYQQTTLCRGEITNQGRATLRNLNPENRGAAPTILVTNLADGTITRHRTPYAPEEASQEESLAPGASLTYPFSLTAAIEFPGPGEYELQLLYEWEGGELRSPAVRVELLGSIPRRLHLVSGKGGFAPLHYGAWIRQPDSESKKFSLCMAHVLTLAKPQVEDVYPLVQDLSEVVEPWLGVPPNEDVNDQWVAWIAKSSLYYLVCREKTTTAPKTEPLDGECRVVPPVLLNIGRDSKVESADVVLYQSGTAQGAGRLRIKHLNPAKRSADDSLELPGSAPIWGANVYLSNRMRHTFLITEIRPAGGVSLKAATWSALKPPAAIAELAAWKAGCLAADAALGADDVALGAALLEAGEPGAPTYALQPWRLKPPADFQSGNAVAVRWLEKKAISSAIVRVDADGAPYALLQGAAGAWYFCDPKGNVSVLPPTAEQLKPPADILFRGGTDPVLLYSDPGRGFQLSKAR